MEKTKKKATSKDRRKARLDRMLDRWRTLSEQQKNPLYVWRAILECFDERVPLPDWCNEYLFHTASSLHLLVQQVLPSERAAGDEMPSLRPEQAAARVAQALQITRQGSNAFAGLVRDYALTADAARQDARKVLKESPVRPSASKGVLPPAKAMPRVDQRTARRRVQKGRTLNRDQT